jgi:hypothetical protein
MARVFLRAPRNCVRASFMRSAGSLILIAALLAGCRGSPGTLMGARDNTRFATDDSIRLVLALEDERGAEIRKLSGEAVRTLLPPGRHFVSVDDRGVRVLAADSEGLSAAVVGEPVRRLDTLPLGWTANPMLNGAGTRIAATNGPGGGLRIVSFDTGEILHDIACPAAASCFWVSWDLEEPDAVWFGSRVTEATYVRFNFARGEVTLVKSQDPPPMRSTTGWLHSQTTCRATGAQLNEYDNRLDLVQSGQQTRTVAFVAGFERPPLSRPETAIDDPSFLEGCRYAIFRFHNRSYLLDTVTGEKGLLAGYPIYVLRSATMDARISPPASSPLPAATRNTRRTP